ncbi:MAG: hypothetical protein HQK83_03925 [Fibrobacteria bacterium]|nr:hypothetical protein [Fibrobacteria bacterium]
MSIRWIRNILVDDEKTTIEIMLGNEKISDKCYIKINNSSEQWFTPHEETRHAIMAQGIALLKKQMEGKNITTPSGSPFDWQ